jgi:hypothetical protein
MFTNDSFNGKGFSAESNLIISGEVGFEELEEPEVKAVMKKYGIKIVDREAIERVEWGGIMGHGDIDYIYFQSKSLEGLEKLDDLLFDGDLKDTIRNNAESHAYSYAYNEGHSDSRKDDGYNPIKSKQDLVPFKRVLKQKAESFSAEECNHCGNVMATSPCCGISHCPVQDFDCACEKHYDPTGHDYPETDPETGERYGNWEWSGDYWYQPKNAESFNAEYPKGEKGYVIYSLGYNEGEQGKGRKTPESFVSMIAKFNDIENSHMLSDDDKSYAIYTIGYFDGESDKINKRTPQAFELMLSKMGKSYGKPLLSSIPKTARLDAEEKEKYGWGAEQRTCKLCGNKGHNARTCKYNKIDFSQGGFWKTREPDANFMPRWGEKLTKAERKKRETKAMKNATELDFPYVDNSHAVMITKIVDGFPMKGNRRINVPRLELPDTMKMTWGEIKTLGGKGKDSLTTLGDSTYSSALLAKAFQKLPTDTVIKIQNGRDLPARMTFEYGGDEWMVFFAPRVDYMGAETSYCHNHKTCGGYRVEGTFLCWPCHDIEADVRIAKRNDAESFKAEKLHPGLYRYKGKIKMRKDWTECQECDDLVKKNDINFAYLEGYGNATVCDACVDKYQGFKRMENYMRENWTSWKDWGEKKDYSKKFVPVRKKYKWGEGEIYRLKHDGIITNVLYAFNAETFEATKGIDTFTEPFEEMGVPKWLIGIGGVVAAITGINYLSKKL